MSDHPEFEVIDNQQSEEVPIKDDLGDESVIPQRYSITNYGADYPVEMLVNRLKSDSIRIPPWQRGFVWTINVASRFVESLLLGLPVPGIFLFKELETERLLVIDGQQRLKTLEYFFKEIFEPTQRVFALHGVLKEFEGKTYQTIAEEDRRRLNDAIIHATIIRQEKPPEEDSSSIYHVFERINSGGIKLLPQEIRAAIFHGKFNNLIGKLNADEYWRSLYGPPSKQMRDQELILRFLALYFQSEKYAAPMKDFLNLYMEQNAHLTLQSEEEISRVFLSTVRTIYESIGLVAFKPERALNAALYDALMVGIARRVASSPIDDQDSLRQQYSSLLSDTEFQDLISRTTANPPRVQRRIELATQFFAEIT